LTGSSNSEENLTKKNFLTEPIFAKLYKSFLKGRGTLAVSKACGKGPTHNLWVIDMKFFRRQPKKSMILYPRFIHRFISLLKYDFHPYDNPAGLFVWKWPSIGRPRIRPAKLFADLLLRQHFWFMIIPYTGRFLETSSKIEHFPDFCSKIANWSSKLKMKNSDSRSIRWVQKY